MNYFSKNKKWMAYLILLTFLFTSIMPSNLGSMNSVAEAAAVNNSQIVKWGGNTNETETSGTYSDAKEYQSYENGDLKIRKTIDGTEIENKFNVTLEVVTTENLSEIDADPNAATVLVMDCSGSMEQNGRADSLKNAATNFIDSFSTVPANTTAVRNVAFVTFADHARSNQIWYNVVNTTQKSNAKSSLNQLLYTNGGTNIEAGLRLAVNLINAEKNKLTAKNGAFYLGQNADGTVKAINNVNIILLTDGNPTYHIANANQFKYNSGNSTGRLSDYGRTVATNEAATDIIYGNRGGGNKSTEADYEPVESLVKNTIKSLTVADSNVNFYSIAFDIGESTTVHGKTVYNWLLDLTGAGKTFTASNQNDLFRVFTAINTLITLGVEAWKVTDPMGEDILFDTEGYNKLPVSERQYNTLTYADDSKTLTWDLTSSVPTSSTENGKTHYTYQVQYPIILDTAKIVEQNGEYQNTFDFDKVRATNGDTILYYYLFSKVGTNDTDFGVLQNKKFNVPAVKGFPGNFEFTKKSAAVVGAAESVLAGAKFKLEGTATGSGESVTLTATSDADGKVSFENIPAGNYTLTETSTPSGYIASQDSKQVVVSYGDTTVDGRLNPADVVVTNTPETVEVAVSKVWDDADNQDGKRPDSITVRLMNGDIEVAVKEVTAKDNWQYTFENVPKYDTAGNEIVYTVTEDTVEGYLKTITGNAATGFVIANTHVPSKVKVEGTKVWDDANNQDGIRPTGITVNLLADGKVVDSKTVTANDSWQYSFTNLDEYKNGQKIVYTVSEDKVDGYTTDINGTEITNSHTPATTALTVQKVWDDADDQDGKRPDELKVTLSEGTEVTLNEANGWKATVENLPKYNAGVEIEYTWTEADVDGYTLVGNVTAGKVTTITNKHVPELTEATVKKVWDDADNQDGKRPAALTVTLSNGTEVTLNDANEWTATVENLPVYANGQEIEYTWTEGDMPEGYELTDTSVDGTITTLTNSYEPEVTSATVKKVWDDANNQDGIRPESLAVTLSNGQSVTLNAENQWTATVENLPVYANGQEIEYTWTEGTLPEGYVLTGTSVEGTVTTLTNSHVPELTEATVKKVWDDANNQDGKRPAELNVTLSNGTEVTLNAANNWTATVTDLPKYEAGQLIAYAWTEGTLPEGYVLTDTSVEGTVTTLTNSYEPEVTSKTVKKVWDDANNQDGKRPTELKVALSNGTEVTLNAANNWTATIDNLPKYEDGELIIYTWTEAKVDGYVQSGLSTASDLTTFTNTHVPETTEATVVKVWDDANDQDGKRPESLEVTLSNGTSVTLNDANNWTATIKDLPVYEAGKVIEYTWTEETVTGYELTDTNVNGTVTTLTNTHIPEVTEASVVKVWDDAQNQDGIRPASLVVTLSNGQSVTLNEGNEWTATINNLPVYANGEEIEYSWTEANVEGYELTDTSVDGTVTTLTNTHTPETTEATVVKVWEDADNQDGKRPVNLKVTLSDGTKVTLNEANDWTATVKDLPKYNAGVEIKYTWTEADVDGYTLVSNVTVGKVTTITNKHVPEVTEASVVKVWDDAQNQDGIRPASLVVTLSNGQSVTLNEGNEWTAAINNLPVYANGERIEYSWTEANVEGYELTGEVTDGTVTTLTNTHIPETTEATVKKVWEDADNQDGKRPASLVATLSNGETVTLSEANNWTATIDNLPKYENGELIIYTWTEASVEGYVQTGLSTASGITTFKNTHKIATTEVAGSKTWNDNNNQDGVRPASITVNLLADGTEIDEATVTAENGWAWSFAELPKYKDGGKEIKYTITEDDVAYYTAEVDGYNITNTHTPATTSIYGEKIWDDNDNAAQARPEYITVELFADGVKVDSTSATAVDWAYAFDNLPVYKNGGETIVYQVVEVAVKDYTTAYTKAVNKNDIQVNIINTYAVEDPEFVTIKGTKVWNDNNDAAGKRPASITVNLFNGGAEPVATTTASLTTDWTYAFTDLPKADENGKVYDYTVTETPVPEYRSVVVETTAGFDIYNSLINGEAGQILVSKLVTGDKAPEDGVYKFVLNINAVKSEWTSLKVYELLQLEKAYEAAVKAYNDAKEAWNDAVDVFKGNAKELNTTGSVLQFAMAEEATSPSGYEYLMIDEDARMTTTSSSYYFDGCEKADEEIVNPVVEAIAKLARDFNRAGGAFLEALLGEVAVPSLGFMRDDVQDLLDEADRLFEAEALMEATSASVYEFKNSPDVTTASAVTLIITDADGNETRVTTSGAYQFEFELTGVKSLAELENEMFKFRFEAEDGTVITYSIEEVDWVKEGYEGTSIKLNGEVVASDVETDDYVLTTGSVYDFVFINDYEDETGGYTPPPYTPPYVPPTDPEIEIEDPEVPLDEPPVIEPGIEIEEPEVPLGDAPRTGDATNAVPFMALMLFAMAGLVATRRRFN